MKFKFLIAAIIASSAASAWAQNPVPLGEDFLLPDPDLVFCPMSIGVTAPECKQLLPRAATDICALGLTYLNGVFPSVSYVGNLSWQYDSTPTYHYETECYFDVASQYGSSRYTIKGSAMSLSRNLYPF